MNRRFVASCGLVCAALVMAGCEEGRQAPGRVPVQVANVAPGFEDLMFRREQEVRNEARLPFKASQAYLWDADDYDFNVLERTLNEADPGRVWTFAQTLEANTSYAFVLTEVAGEVQPVVIPYPAPPTADAQILALHAAGGQPALDLYLERPGVGIAGATPRGTFNAQEQIAPRTLPSGDYELFLTAAGNPAAVLLSSSLLSLPTGTTSTFVVVAESGQSTSQISVLLMQASTVVLYDRNATAETRVINGATDRAPRDFAINSQFSPPLFPAVPFGEPTPYAQIPVGQIQIQVTPVGNPGVLELDTAFTGIVDRRTTMLVGGPAGALIPSGDADDGRRLNREAKLRLMNAASQFPGVDFVLTLPGGDPLAQFPVATLFAPGFASYVPLYPRDYDLYLFRVGTTTVLSGPTSISVTAGGIYGALAVDGPDTATASVLLFDDFP